MTAEQFVTIAYLAVSGESLVAQLFGFRRLRLLRAERWLIRTSACRVGASALYVLVGANALFLHYHTLLVAFTAYLATALTWQVNTRLDIRAHRPKRERRRRRFSVTITIGSPVEQTGSVNTQLSNAGAPGEPHL